MYEARISENLPRVTEAIRRAAERAGRDAGDVTLVAVSKAHPPEALRAALAAGVTHLGENRVEEMEGKVRLLGRGAAVWHMVGHVQGRKAKQAAESADLIHSLDTLKLGQRLSRLASELPAPIRVLMQVNIAGEEAKSGFPADEAVEALGQILELPGIEVRGLMTMAPFVDEEVVLRKVFRGLREIQEKAEKLPGYRGRELSMGMTNDFELAIEEGSTMVRIGTALFGERPR